MTKKPKRKKILTAGRSGREPLITPEITNKIIALLTGLPIDIDSMCCAVGISDTTYHRWMSEGEKPDSLPAYREFREAIRKARAECKIMAVDTMVKHSKMDPATARWILERRYRDEWGPNKGEGISQTVNVGVQVTGGLSESQIAEIQAEKRACNERMIKLIEDSKKQNGNGANGRH